MEKNLKAKVKLLQDKAPKDHFLAYINANEAKLLKKMGGSGEMTPQGIPSFRPQDMGNAANQASSAASTGSSSNSSSSNSSSSNSSSSSSNSSSGGGDNRYTGTEDLEEQVEIDNKIAAEQKAKDQFDYEGDAYSNIKTTVTPQFDQKGKFIGVKTDGVGVVKGETYTAKTIQGVMLDSTISDKEKIATLNQLQAIANSTRNSGKPQVDIEGKAYIQNALEVSLDSLKNDKFFDDLTSKMDLDASTYNDSFFDAPAETFLKASVGLTGVNPITGALQIIGKSLLDSYKNKQALDILGFDGTKLKPNYAQVGDDGGILTNKEYLLGNTLNRDQINEAVPDIISGGDSLPDSMVNSYFDNVTSGAFSQSYNDIKARLENQISTSQNGKVHKDNIFYDYLQKEGLLNG